MNKLIFFTKTPKQGQVKTRLIPAVGATGAVEIHKELAQFTINRIKPSENWLNCRFEISFSGDDKALMVDWLGKEYCYSKQDGCDLGEKMSNAFKSAFNEGYRKVVIIGTDCPEISKNDLKQAFDFLEYADLVLGPAYDGGYYCIGLKSNQSEIFKGIDWGSHLVFDQTIKAAEILQLKTQMLPMHHDIDRPEDLALWKEIKNQNNQKLKEYL